MLQSGGCVSWASRPNKMPRKPNTESNRFRMLASKTKEPNWSLIFAACALATMLLGVAANNAYHWFTETPVPRARFFP